MKKTRKVDFLIKRLSLWSLINNGNLLLMVLGAGRVQGQDYCRFTPALTDSIFHEEKHQ